MHAAEILLPAYSERAVIVAQQASARAALLTAAEDFEASAAALEASQLPSSACVRTCLLRVSNAVGLELKGQIPLDVRAATMLTDLGRLQWIGIVAHPLHLRSAMRITHMLTERWRSLSLGGCWRVKAALYSYVAQTLKGGSERMIFLHVAGIAC